MPAPFLTPAARTALDVEPARQQVHRLASDLGDVLAALPRVVHVDYAPQLDGEPGAYVMTVQGRPDGADDVHTVATVVYQPRRCSGLAHAGRGASKVLTMFTLDAVRVQVGEWATEDAAALAAA